MKEPNIPYMQYKWIDINDQKPPLKASLYCWITVKLPSCIARVLKVGLRGGKFYYNEEPYHSGWKTTLVDEYPSEYITAWMPYTDPLPYTGKNTLEVLEVEVDDESL